MTIQPLNWYPVILEYLTPQEQSDGFTCEANGFGEACMWYREFPHPLSDARHYDRSQLYGVTFDAILRGQDYAKASCMIGSADVLYNVTVVVFRTQSAVIRSEYASYPLERSCMQTLISFQWLREHLHKSTGGLLEFCRQPPAEFICPWPIVFQSVSASTHSISCAARADPLPTVVALWNGVALTQQTVIQGVSIHGHTVKFHLSDLWPHSRDAQVAGLLTCIAHSDGYQIIRHHLLYFTLRGELLHVNGTSMSELLSIKALGTTDPQFLALPPVYIDSSVLQQINDEYGQDLRSLSSVGQSKSRPSRTRPLFSAWLGTNSRRDSSLVLSRIQSAANTSSQCQMLQGAELVPNVLKTTQESWQSYPVRVGLSCYKDTGCVHRTVIFNFSSVSISAGLAEHNPRGIAIGSAAAVLLTILALICIGLGIRRAQKQGRCRGQKIKSQLKVPQTEDDGYPSRENWHTYDASESLLMPPSESGIPGVFIAQTPGSVDQYTKKRISLIRTKNSCLHCTGLYSTASYENLYSCKQDTLETTEKRYATSLPSLYGSGFCRNQSANQQTHGTNKWGKLANGIWNIDPQRLRISRLLGFGAHGRVMRAQLALPSAGENICMQLRKHIFRVTSHQTQLHQGKDSDVPSIAVAVKEVFFNGSQTNECSSFCSDVSTTFGPAYSAVPQRVSSERSSCLCIYAELAPVDASTPNPLAPEQHDLTSPSTNGDSTAHLPNELHELRLLDDLVSGSLGFAPVTNPPPQQRERLRNSRSKSAKKNISSHHHKKCRTITNPLFEAELAVMKSAGSHPNVVALIGQCMFPGFGPVLVIEYCPRGNLRAYLQSLRSNLTHNQAEMPQFQEQLLAYTYQVAKGMKYLASRNIIHRDLAARNVLLSADWTCKISDFGLSRQLDPNTEYYLRDRGALPLKWLAPEVLETKKFSQKSDVWSYGVLVWEIYTLGGTPYTQFTMDQVRNLIQHGYRMSRPPLCPIWIGLLMQESWSTVPADRPDFVQIVHRLERNMSVK